MIIKRKYIVLPMVSLNEYVFKEIRVVKTHVQMSSMQKKNNEQIDKNDLKIIQELQKYSKNSIETIARQCGFSRQKIWRVIKNLEEKQIIWGYSTIVDEQKQGLQKFILLLKRTMDPIDEETVDSIAFSRLEKEYNEIGITIESSYYIHGEYDWTLIFTAKDLKHAKKLSAFLLTKYPGIIGKVNLMQILYSQRSHHIVNPNKKKLREFL